MLSNNKIYFIIPTYGRIELTSRLVNSLLQANIDNEIILIDDELTFITFSKFHLTDNIHCLKGTGNLWWGGAINLGISYLNSLDVKEEDIIIFANNDMYITEKNLKVILNELKIEKNHIVHPRTFDDKGNEISSGAIIKSWFPYITTHPINFITPKIEIDLGTARCLAMSHNTLQRVGKISSKLPHYQGDNDFTLRAKSKGIKTYILRDCECIVDDKDTGLKNNRIPSLIKLWQSFFITRSSNNIKYRFYFVCNHKNFIFSLLVVSSMTINSIFRYLISKSTNKN